MGLNRDDLGRVRDILVALPQWRDAASRHRLLTYLLYDLPKRDLILGNVDLEGAPRSAALDTVLALEGVTEVKPGVVPLEVFLENLAAEVADTNTQEELERFLGQMRSPVAALPAAATPDADASHPLLNLKMVEFLQDCDRQRVVKEVRLAHQTWRPELGFFLLWGGEQELLSQLVARLALKELYELERVSFQASPSPVIHHWLFDPRTVDPTTRGHLVELEVLDLQKVIEWERFGGPGNGHGEFPLLVLCTTTSYDDWTGGKATEAASMLELFREICRSYRHLPGSPRLLPFVLLQLPSATGAPASTEACESLIKMMRERLEPDRHQVELVGPVQSRELKDWLRNKLQRLSKWPLPDQFYDDLMNLVFADRAECSMKDVSEQLTKHLPQVLEQVVKAQETR